MKIYFGHPVNTYNTELEKSLLEKIAKKFPDYEIENPNQPHHQAGYQLYKSRYNKGMLYYYQEVLAFCQAGIFLPFRDGKWGAGVCGEAEFLLQKEHLVYQITYLGGVTPIIDATEIPRLSIEETRQRTKRPY